MTGIRIAINSHSRTTMVELLHKSGLVEYGCSKPGCTVKFFKTQQVDARCNRYGEKPLDRGEL